MITYRFKVTGLEHKENAIKAHPNGSCMIPIWHEHAMGILTAHAGSYPFLVLASRSKDGDFAAYVSQKFGFIPVRGSSRKGQVDKGGKEAMEAYVQKLKEGHLGGITVDGPKGPRHHCKPGIVIIAAKAECMILPIVASYSHFYEFKKAWDKFKIPYPFSKILVRHGSPIAVPKDATAEEIELICKEIDKGMLLTQKLADLDLKHWPKEARPFPKLNK